MTTPNGELGGLSGTQQSVIAACEQIIEEYRRKTVTRARAVRSLSATLSSTETELDDAAADATLDSYLDQLDDVDRIRTEAGRELQERFRTQSDGNENESRGANQERQSQSDSQVTLPSQRQASRQSSLATGAEESRSPSCESSTGDHHDKRQRPDPKLFLWTEAEQATNTLLRPELQKTLARLKNYGKDIKFSKSKLLNSGAAPEFPDAEWTNILNGHAVDLDHVLTNMYALSADDRHVQHVGDIEFRYRTVTPVKTIQSAGDWVIAWQRTALATAYAFPDRRAELDEYHSHIFGLFASVDKSLHQRVIHYDRAVRKRVGSVRNLLLTDTEQFSTLRTLWIDSCGANALSQSSITPPNRPSPRSRRDREPCIRWNKGLCTAHPSDCRYRHVCSVCGANHSKRNCKWDQP